MARGKKPPDPNLESDIDRVEFLPLIKAIGDGANIEPDAPIRHLTAVSFARLAEAAVEQNRTYIPKRVGDFRRRARNMIESALVEECWLSGARASLETLLATNDISAEAYANKIELFGAHYDEVWRKAALHCALILEEMQQVRLRKGIKGSPKGSRHGDALVQMLDLQILGDAINRVPEADRTKRDAIASRIPEIVREFMRLGQLRYLGSTNQESVDRHSKRLRNLLDRLPNTTRLGGFSIIRKDQ